MRQALTNETIASVANECYKRLLTLPAFINASCIYLYLSHDNEVDTLPIIQYCERCNIPMAAPRVEGQHDMNFYYFTSMNDLREGAFHILEPQGNQLAIDENACVLIPGIAFDFQGNRIGYGGGYYDNYLSKHSNYTTIALAYDFQIIPHICTELQDQSVEYIITDKQLIQRKGRIS